MKITLIIAAIAIATVSPAFSEGKPTGKLTINRKMVREGYTPDMKWKIKLPITTVKDVIETNDQDVVTAKEKLRMDVYMVGSGVTSSNGGSITYWTTKSEIKFHDSWNLIYQGNGEDLMTNDSSDNSSVIRISTVLEQGDSVWFRARYTDGGSQRYNENDEIEILYNGDEPPHNPAANGVTSAEDYLKPYIVNGKLALGPLDFIYCSELTHTDKSKSGYDLQDSIVLVRFTQIK